VDDQVAPFDEAFAGELGKHDLAHGVARALADEQDAQAVDAAGFLRARAGRGREDGERREHDGPPPHSITSSAAAISAGGTVSPIARAGARLTTSSNLVGSCTGMSAGCSPRRTRAT